MRSTDEIWRAAQFGDLADVMRIIDAQGLPLTKDERGDSLLAVACRAGHEDVVAYLVDIGADENGSRGPQIAPHAFEAMENGHLEVVRAICENGWGLQTHVVEGKYGMNLIDSSVFRRKTEIVRYLLEQGHEIDVWSVLEREQRYCPSDLDDAEELLAIERAMQAGAADLVLFLCEVGVDLGEHDRDYYYERALLIAAERLTESGAERVRLVREEADEQRERAEAKQMKFRRRRAEQQELLKQKMKPLDFVIMMLFWVGVFYFWQFVGALWDGLRARF